MAGKTETESRVEPIEWAIYGGTFVTSVGVWLLYGVGAALIFVGTAIVAGAVYVARNTPAKDARGDSGGGAQADRATVQPRKP